MSLKIQEIAAIVDGKCDGDLSVVITGIAGLRDAREGEISFLANPRYSSLVAETKASVVLVDRNWSGESSSAVIRVDNPDKAFALIAESFASAPVKPPAGIHPSAVVADDLKFGDDVSIGPNCTVEPGVQIGDRTVVFGGCYIGHDVKLGDDVCLYPLVSIRERAEIGNRVIIHNGTVIGSDGFGYTVDDKGIRTKIPQNGRVIIGDDVEIGANVTVDRARFGATRIGNGVKIDNLVQVAHNVIIGDNSVIVAQVALAGSAVIGEGVVLAGQAGVSGHIEVGDGAVLAAKSAATKNVPAGAFVSGFPARPHKEEQHLKALYRKLPDFKKKLSALEARLQELEKKIQ